MNLGKGKVNLTRIIEGKCYCISKSMTMTLFWGRVQETHASSPDDSCLGKSPDKSCLGNGSDNPSPGKGSENSCLGKGPDNPCLGKGSENPCMGKGSDNPCLGNRPDGCLGKSGYPPLDTKLVFLGLCCFQISRNFLF